MSDERESTNDGIGRRTFLATTAAGAAAVVGSQIPGEVAAMTSDSVGENGDFRRKLLECLGGPWPEGCELRAIHALKEPTELMFIQTQLPIEGNASTEDIRKTLRL